MRFTHSIIVGFLFTLVFALAAFAQTPAAGKIGLVDTRYFDNGKDGITKYSTAMDGLEKEFETDGNALKTMATRMQTLETEIKNLRDQISQPKSPIKPETVNAKLEEYEKLGREFKFKQEDAKARYERKELVVMGPIRQDIGKALQEFAKQKGVSMIFDTAKLSDAGLVLAADDSVNLTQEFIKFYNARPATAAVTGTK